jgi:hypothetical protein
MNHTRIQITGTVCLKFLYHKIQNNLLNFILHDNLTRFLFPNKHGNTAYEYYPDHRPTISLWSSILSQVHDDKHSKSTQSTPLHVSIIGRIDTVSIALVEAKTNVNVPDELGITPLMLSVLFGNKSQLNFSFLIFYFLVFYLSN